jgi:tRNA(fMet)-specific endonuclease VapC
MRTRRSEALPGYLLDTNHVQYWYDPRCPENARVSAHVATLLSGNIFISAVTIGEVRFGHQRADKPCAIKQASLEQWIQTQFPHPSPLAITELTTIEYAKVRAMLFKLFPPKGKKQKRPEDCFDWTMSKELGIDENDLWIASQAMEHNLILVTHDGMHRIRTAASGLNPPLIVQDWA